MIVKGHSMAGILVLVVLGILLSDQGCDGAGVRRLTRRRKVLPASGKTPTDDSGIKDRIQLANNKFWPHDVHYCFRRLFMISYYYTIQEIF